MLDDTNVLSLSSCSEVFQNNLCDNDIVYDSSAAHYGVWLNFTIWVSAASCSRCIWSET